MKKLLLFPVLIASFCCSQTDKKLNEDPVFLPYASIKNLEYGYLEVPADRRTQSTKTIKLAYMVLKASNGNSKKDPLVYLQGGPGGSTLFMANFWQNHPLREDRDIVLMDQRGTGASDAVCSNFGSELIQILAQDLSPEAEYEETLKRLEKCRAQAKASGVSFEAFNSRENAADFESLRKKLGYGKWNLFGGSYGSRLGLTMLRDFPESVRSAILFSVFAPETDLYASFTSNFKRSLFKVFNQCKKDPSCNGRYPDLKNRYLKSLERLNKQPITFDYQGSAFVLNVQDVLLMTHQILYQRTRIGQIPAFVLALETGDDEILGQALTPTVITSSAINVPMYLSVMAFEELPFNGASDFVEDLDKNPEFPTGPAFFNSDTKIMTQWHRSRATAEENEPVSSDIPTLLFNGSLDPITPTANAKGAAKHLKNSYFFEFENEGHSLFNSCFFQICRDFLDQPADKPAAACASEPFKINWQ
ncbi:alpha/beta hydrolase [Poritiphilus flavus]|uniref:Proline iminopeptidase n=1 Tax=Poritiphilus flavus TaxID=2697053 RepID=A0A6L9ED31_9FLAO|nr:alpha/beta fold hydrolase [Poritiphilus flavus]NAS12523.1 alpha/beta fold hydrolase [Poritiphilus flavus]